MDVTFRVFDADGDGRVDASEFAEMMSSIAAAQAGRRATRKEDGLRCGGAVPPSRRGARCPAPHSPPGCDPAHPCLWCSREVVPDLSTLAAGHRLFGSDLSSSLTSPQFKEVLEFLRRSIVYYEFCCYRALEGSRSGEGACRDACFSQRALPLPPHPPPPSSRHQLEHRRRARPCTRPRGTRKAELAPRSGCEGRTRPAARGACAW